MSDSCRVTILVGPDCLGPALVGLLGSAAGRLDVAVYEVGPRYAWLLAAAAERGADVRLLADDHTGPLTGALRTLGEARGGGDVSVRVCGGRIGERAHWKLVVTGWAGSAETTVAVGTGNLDERDAPYGHAPPLQGTREVWIAVSGHPALESQARVAIAAAWRTARRAGEVTPLAAPPHIPPVGDPGTHLSGLTLEVPRDAVTLAAGPAPAGARLLASALATARRRALICVPYVHAGANEVEGLLDGLRLAAARGADVRLLLGQPVAAGTASAGVERLATMGVEARVMDPLRTTTGHAKVVIVDDRLLCGSANWSRAGLTSNLEATLAVDHPAAADWVAGVIDHDWDASA